MSRLSLSFLGGFDTRLSGNPLSGFKTDKTRALLAYLAIETGRPQHREKLAGLLWPNFPERSARENLRHALSNLRQILGDAGSSIPFILVEDETIQFNISSDFWCDVGEFLRLSEIVAQTKPGFGDPSLVSNLQAALRLYRGIFLESFNLKDCPEFDDWTLIQRERIRLDATASLQYLVKHFEASCENLEAISYAQRWLELEPWQEEAHFHLMKLYALNGNRTKALDQFHFCRQKLQDELNVEPSSETLQLYESIRSGKFSQPQPRNPPFSQLPTYLTPLVGRAKELDEIAQLLADPACRLLSLVGPGGCGKTRLAVETASRQTSSYQDGVCFVPLVAVERVEAIVPSILHALGVTTPISDLNQAMFGFLQHKELLLVLDNFEQLLLEGSELLPALLSQAPQVQLLVTSRQRLHLDSENVYLVEGLSLPTTQQAAEARSFDAIQLFSQTAQRQRGYPISDAELPEVVRICRSVGGMPLAIKIAASWTRALTCAEIAAEIERSLRFLESDDRELQARHRSVQAVFESTWQRLSPEEQSAFPKLAVFRGGFTRQAFEAIAGASLQILTSLVDQCLVTHRPNGRYELHELLRQFAEEKLSQGSILNAVSEQHCEYYLNFIQGFHEKYIYQNLGTLREDGENIEAAWFFAVRHDQFRLLESALKFFVALFSPGRVTLRRNIYNRTLASLSTNAPETLIGWLLAYKGMDMIYMDFKPCKEALEKSLEIAERLGSRKLEAFVLNQLGEVCFFEDYPKAIPYLEKSISISQQEGYQEELAYSYQILGQKNHSAEEAVPFLQKSLSLYRSLNDDESVCDMLLSLGVMDFHMGKFRQAEKYFQETLKISRDIDDKDWNVNALTLLGIVAYRDQKLASAKSYFEDSFDIRKDGSVGIWLCRILEEQGSYLELKQVASQALIDFRENDQFNRDIRAPIQIQFSSLKVGEGLLWLYKAEWGLGNIARAQDYLRQALDTWARENLTQGILKGLFTWSIMLSGTKTGEFQQKIILSLELLELILNHPGLDVDYVNPGLVTAFASVTRHEVEQAAAQLEGELPASEAASARERGSRLVLEEVVQDLVAGRGRYWEG